MENNKCCAIFFPSSFFGAEKNGSRSCICFGKYSRFDCRIFSIFRVFVWASVWFCACFCRPALAEFSDSDSQQLLGIKANTAQTNAILDGIREINGDIAAATSDSLDALNDNYDLLQDNVDLLQDLFRSIGYRYDGSESLSKDLDTVINFLTKYESILGYGVGSSQTGTVKTSLDTIDYDINALKNTLGFSELSTLRAKLDEIILALENLQDSGGSGSEEITQDWVKEDTFNVFSSKYEEFANRYYTAFGFSQEESLKDYLNTSFGFNSSSESPSSFFDMFFNKRYFHSFYYWQFNDAVSTGAPTTPFPGNSYSWVNDYPEWSLDKNSTRLAFTYSELFTYPVIKQLSEGTIQDIKLFKKQAWNDWQAHTNTLSRLDMIVESLNTVPEERISGTDDIGTIAENQLNISFDKSTGDSPESIDLQPAFTNDLAELTAPANDLTNKVANLITYSKLSNRYKTPNVDNTNYRDYEITQDIPDYTLQYGTRPGMSFKFTSTARDLFRGFLSRETMANLRSIFLKLWMFLALYCNFVIFKIFGKMGGNE